MSDPFDHFRTGTPTIFEGVGLIVLSVALTGMALTRAAVRRLRRAG